MGVARLRRTLDTESAIEPVLKDMAGSIGEAMKEIRVLSYLLNPPNLERDGLALTARRFVLGFGGRSGLNALFRAEGRLQDVGPDIQRAAFRVIQEALSNVHRHAEAAGVEVDLSLRGKQLVLRIADDGRGIADPEALTEAGGQLGVGIPGMRARVSQLGGVLSISGDAAGTVLEAMIPIPRSFKPGPSRPARSSGPGPDLGAAA
jgi:signal transduction histidine kinase